MIIKPHEFWMRKDLKTPSVLNDEWYLNPMSSIWRRTCNELVQLKGKDIVNHLKWLIMWKIFVILLVLTMLNSEDSYQISCNRNAKISLIGKKQFKIISFQNYKHWFLICNTYLIRTMPSKHGGSLEITPTVPLSTEWSGGYKNSLSTEWV